MPMIRGKQRRAQADRGGYLDAIRNIKTYREFKKIYPDVDITQAGFDDLKNNMARYFGESGRTISQFDVGEFINRNDGGIAKKTRVF
tara:strand:+ start:1016 stop:1276 length:261 start_codon:yes stop_codon:yes gene_type:complete